MYEWNDFVTDGGLMSYGTVRVDLFHQAGIYAARILRGEKAGDLPVVNLSRFVFSINMKTAKALGLEVPPSLLAITDEAIE
jgi:putative tryptophan/tyrosine transport system substrate-binding protein